MKRIDRTERRELGKKLGRLTLALGAVLVGPVTPQEVSEATDALDDLVSYYRHALSTMVDEPAPKDAATQVSR